MFDTALLDAMPYTATFTPVTERDMYGNRTYGAGAPFPCYWVETDDDTESSVGQALQHTGTLWLPPPSYWTPPAALEPTTGLGLVLPDGQRVSVTKVTTYRDGDGLYGFEVAYG